MTGERGSEAGVRWGVGGWSPPLGKSWRQHGPQGLGGLCRKMGGMDQTGNKPMAKVPHSWCSTVCLLLGTAWLDPKPEEDVSYRVPKIRNRG